MTPHPCEELADDDSVAWADRFRLVDGDSDLNRVESIRCGSCAAHTYPYARDGVVLLGSRLITWLFLFDDLFGEGSRVRNLRHLMETLAAFETAWRSGRAPYSATAFHHALLDLRATAVELGADAEWIRRFGDSLGRYFDGCQLEFIHRQAGVPPSLLQYRQLRAWSIGTLPVFDLIELEDQHTLSHEQVDHPSMIALRERAAMLCAWVNDVYSYEKEKRARDPLNLVAVLVNEYGVDDRAAYCEAAEIFNRDLEQFERAATSIQHELGSSVVRYLYGLRTWIHGNFTWTAICRRYTDSALGEKLRDLCP